MVIQEEHFPSEHFIRYSGYPFPTLSFRAQREIFFVPFFHDSFAKPFTGSTVTAFPAIRCFPFLAAKHAPSYRQRKRSLGFARDDVAEAAFSQHILYAERGLSTPIPSFRVQSRNLPCTLFFLAPFADAFSFSAITHTTLSLPAKKIPRLRSG